MINIESFNTVLDGKQVRLFTLQNAHGLTAQITNYGAKIVSFIVPTKTGEMRDIVLGFSSFEEWKEKETYFNAVIGRYANRIKDGRFTLDGKQYQLAINNGTNSLHGGVVGFNRKVWDVMEETENSVLLHYLSPDGEENYPGNLDVFVTYRLTDDNALEISYEATTDKPTILGFTNHAYFNLNGEGNGDIKNHTLQVFADYYTPFDDTACPTGEILPVDGTPMDFRQPTLIADRIDDQFFSPGRGIDNNFVLLGVETYVNASHSQKSKVESQKSKEILKQVQDEGKVESQTHTAAVLSIDDLTMEVFTTMPGLQVYTGNWVEKNIGKSGHEYDVQTAICLEAQNFPNSPNIPSFPSPVLRQGEVYQQQCVYKIKKS